MLTSSLLATEDSSLDEANDAQVWLRTRFRALAPEEFSRDGVIVYSASDLTPPEGFHHVWQRVASHHRVGEIASEEERTQLDCAAVLLVLADASSQDQMQNVLHFGCFIDSLRAVGSEPIVILLLHSVAPHVRPAIEEHLVFFAGANALRNGFHDVIVDEPASFKLAWAVRSRILEQDALLQDAREQKKELFKQRDMFRLTKRDIVWDYLRTRLDSHLPKVDQQIPRGEPRTIYGFGVGDYLGGGAFARVFKLTLGGAPIGLAVKMVPKGRLASIQGITSIRQQIEVMSTLSSEAWAHPHIVRMHAIYHSRTHVFFSMEEGGSQNLLNRLHNRDMMASALSSPKAKTIMEQTLAATCHLHLALGFAHLGIDCANILVSETDTHITIKICDFDTVVIESGGPITKVVGSHPCVAPEVVLQGSYHPLVADIWSVGIVFVQVLCRVNVIDQALGLHVISSRKKIAEQVRTFFKRQDSVEFLLTSQLHPELADLMRADVFLGGMLDVVCTKRWECRKVVESFSHVF